MSCRTMVFAFALVGLFSGRGWAQSPRVDELRERIEALQAQLELLETSDVKNQRVTQLGGSRSTERESSLIVRIYDLSDLFAMAPPYAAQHVADLGGDERLIFPQAPIDRSGGGMGGGGMGGGGFFGVQDNVNGVPVDAEKVLSQFGGQDGSSGASAGPRTSLDDLIQVVENTISPASWDTMGGNQSIGKLGASLVVSADQRSHQQIEDLFNSFRQRWRSLRTVSMRAWWLWLTDTQLDALLQRGDEPPRESPFGIVDAVAWQELLRQIEQPDENRPAGYRAAMTCYNGQTVHAVSESQSLAVTGLEPVVVPGTGKTPGKAVYRPTMASLREGAALQVTPLASRAGKFVVLDIHSRVVRLHRDESAIGNEGAQVRKGLSAPGDVAAALDRPRMTTHRLSTTLRMPVDKVMLVGGMTFDSQPLAGQPSLYLFVRASVQELRDDLPDEKPAVGPKLEPAAEKKPNASNQGESNPDEKPGTKPNE